MNIPRFPVVGLNLPPLSLNDISSLVREGLAVEYIPHSFATTDFLTEPALRAHLLATALPQKCCLVHWSALWVHVGFASPLPLPFPLCAAHPGRSRPPIIIRKQMTSSSLVHIGGIDVTTPARTALDLLTYTPLDRALTATLTLIHQGLHIEEIFHLLRREPRRFYRKRTEIILQGINKYLTDR